MKNEDAIAEFVLKEAETKNSLRKRINESAPDYYSRRHLFGLFIGLPLIGLYFYLLVSQSIPLWGLIALAMATAAQMESKRNSGRIDAMIKLSNLEKSDPNTLVDTSSPTGDLEKQLNN